MMRRRLAVVYVSNGMRFTSHDKHLLRLLRIVAGNDVAGYVGVPL